MTSLCHFLFEKENGIKSGFEVDKKMHIIFFYLFQIKLHFIFHFENQIKRDFISYSLFEIENEI